MKFWTPSFDLAYVHFQQFYVVFQGSGFNPCLLKIKRNMILELKQIKSLIV